jgi:RNA polymerase subunit RPABC4/transcription elongation factor Spt4
MQELECYNCGALNNFGNKFCTSCGEIFQYSCPNCNAIVNPGSKFCSTCAAELSWNITPQAAPPETSWVKPVEIPLPEETAPFQEEAPRQYNTQTEIEKRPYERAAEPYEKTTDTYEKPTDRFDKVEDRPTGRRRNIIPFIVIVALLIFFVLVIFVSDIFLKF